MGAARRRKSSQRREKAGGGGGFSDVSDVSDPPRAILRVPPTQARRDAQRRLEDRQIAGLSRGLRKVLDIFVLGFVAGVKTDILCDWWVSSGFNGAGKSG